MTFEELMKEKAELHTKIATAEDPEGTAPMNTPIESSEAVAAHKAAYTGIGIPIQMWTDDDGCLCIRWSCGSWWHYAIENDEIVWW